MIAAAQVAWQVVDGEALIVDLASGVTIALNASGTLIWECLMDGTDDIPSRLVERFGIESRVAEADAGEFINMLLSRKLVTGGGRE